MGKGNEGPAPSGWGFFVVLGGGLSALAALLYWLIGQDAVVWLVWANRWIADTFIERLGHGGVFLLMFIESSFIPFPSEIVVPPAADLARRLPDWHLWLVIVMGVSGSLAGALVNYALARYLGRTMLLALVRRFGRWVRVTEPGYLAAEGFFQRHGGISTFTGRLIPGIRQIISLPAGLAHMNLALFSFLTALGAGIWVVFLALLGYWMGGEPERLAAALRTWSHWLVLGGVGLVAGYALIYRFRQRKAARKGP